ACEIRPLQGQTGNVTAWSRQVRNQAAANWIVGKCQHHGNNPGGLLDGEAGGSPGENDIHLEPEEFGSALHEAFVLSFSPAILDRAGAAVDPPELVEPIHEG